MTTIDTLATCTQQNRDAVYTLLRRYFTANRTLLLQSDLREGLLQTEQDCGQSDMLRAFVFRLQEGIFQLSLGLSGAAARNCQMGVHADSSGTPHSGKINHQ